MSRKRFASKPSVALIALPLFLSLICAAATPAEDRLANEVRKALVTLPYYSIFDDLSYRINGSTVELFGQVTRPVLKDDAERAVKHIEGVQQVKNNIEVLPLSPMDDAIRVAVYRAIYGNPALNRYLLQPVPSIHIIVKNGNVTLTGVVANEMDRTLAELQARSVPGTFSVTNNLKVETSEKKVETSEKRPGKK
ncbi:MAG: transport-associated protein [Bryobacterales bacterium]|nr:transport-associated protein [Bryobacterales bacterium]